MKTISLNVNYGGQSFIGFAFSALPLGAALIVAQEQIDQAADQARLSVLGDPMRAVEYQLTAEEAEAFAAVNHVGEVPGTVQAWMDAVGKDAVSATGDILAKAGACKAALYDIRAARLKGKHEVLLATSHEAVEVIADKAIAAISASIRSIGNAA